MTEPQTTKQDAKKELAADLIHSRREVEFNISLEGLRKAWKNLFYDLPFDGYKWLAKKVAVGGRKMLTGKAAIITMPLGIMFRNGAWAAHGAADGRDWHASHVVGSVAAAGAWWLAGSALYNAGMAYTGIAATTGKVGMMIGAAVSGSLAIAPAFMVCTLVTATALAAVVTVASVLPSAYNFLKGIPLLRTKDAWNGIVYDEKVLAENDNHKQWLQQDEYRNLSRASNLVGSLSEESQQTVVLRTLANSSDDMQKTVYQQLKAKFDKAAEKQKEKPATNDKAVSEPATPSANDWEPGRPL